MLKARANSVTSDYFSDSGEASLGLPSLIHDHEFILNLDHVDEESLSSRTSKTESRAASRNTLRFESSSVTPPPEYPLEDEDIRFLSSENGDARFLRLSDTESDRFLSSSDKENCHREEKLEGRLKQNSLANQSAKKDFLKLVPETRLLTVKSLRGFNLSLEQISHSIKSTSQANSSAPELSCSKTFQSSNLEPQCSDPQVGAKSCRGPEPAASWHPSYNASQAPVITIKVDEPDAANMENDKGNRI